MTVAITSQQAYTAIKGKLGTKQTIVYEALKVLGQASNEDIADHLGWPINRVTGRMTELRNYGMAAVAGITRNKSGFSAKLWSACDINDKNLEMDCE